MSQAKSQISATESEDYKSVFHLKRRKNHAVTNEYGYLFVLNTQTLNANACATINLELPKGHLVGRMYCRRIGSPEKLRMFFGTTRRNLFSLRRRHIPKSLRFPLPVRGM